MYNYAYIVDNTVTGVLVFDNHDLPSVFGEAILVTEETGPAAPGFLWDGTVFTPPVEPEVITVEPEVTE